MELSEKTNTNERKVTIKTAISVTGHEVEYPCYQILDHNNGNVIKNFSATYESEQRPPCPETCCPYEREFGYTVEHYSYPKLENVLKFCKEQNFMIQRII